jgi:Leucine-rich repeat (LRR) protein
MPVGKRLCRILIPRSLAMLGLIALAGCNESAVDSTGPAVEKSSDSASKNLSNIPPPPTEDPEQRAGRKLEEMDVIVVRTFGEVSTLNFCEKPISPEALDQLKQCTNLQALLLNGTKIRDDQLQALHNMDRLSSLVLNSNPITAAGLRRIEGLKQIADLHLAETEVSDAGLDSVAKLPKLSILNLSKTKVTDEGLKKLQSLPELANLLLDETAVTDAGLKTIAQFPALKRLSLSKSKVTPAGVKALQDALPGLTVDYKPAP